MKIDLFDAHCDTLSRCLRRGTPYDNGGSLRKNSGHLDLERARERFGRYCQVFAVFADRGTPEDFAAQYGLFRRELAANEDLVLQCRTAEEAGRANDAGRTAAFLAVEGAELLGCDMGLLEDAYRKGVRSVNLTWNYENALSGSNAEGADKGLTGQGRAFVRKMQQLGILVDVSHLSDPGFWDVAELSVEAGVPFIAGHSNARALCPHKRNLTDEQFTAIIKANGVAGLNMCGEFLGEDPTLDTVITHIEHWMALGGGNHIAMGGDWDGCGLFTGLSDITGLEGLYERLLRLNYRESDVQAVFYKNMMRVVSDVCTM